MPKPSLAPKLSALFVSLALVVGLMPSAAFASSAENSVSTDLAAGSSSINVQSNDNSQAKTLTTQASSSKYVRGTFNYADDTCSTKVGGKTFTVKKVKTGNTPYRYTLYVKQNGKTRKLATKTSGIFFTNGSKVVYAKSGNKVISSVRNEDWKYRKNTIYIMNVKTGKQTKLASGVGWEPWGCNGSYVYCGKSGVAAVDGSTMYAVNVKSKKKKFMGNGYDVVGYASGRVACRVISNVSGTELYTFKANGSGKKKIANVANSCYAVKGKKLYYIAYKQQSYSYGTYRAYSCSMTGANKKALSSWTTSWQTLKDKYIS